MKPSPVSKELRTALLLIIGFGGLVLTAFGQEKNINPSDQSEMVWIPGGDFLMGSNAEELAQIWKKFDWDTAELEFTKSEQPAHPVHLNGFWMYRTLVTVADYRKFTQKKGLTFPEPPNYGWQDENPMVKITWEEAAYYCSCNGGRLPTEAEWEYAARAGKTGFNGQKKEVFIWGNELPKAPVANLADDDFLKARYYDHDNFHGFRGYQDGYVMVSPVRSFAPNAYGLYDMAGNVLEWCSDWYGDYSFSKSPQSAPQGPSQGDRKVLRGGAFDTTPTITRIARRLGNFPNIRHDEKGFRCVMN